MESTSYTQDGPGSFILRDFISDVPLGEDENGVRAHITCVDAWNGNVYIGTSAGEILHYFQIPPDPSEPQGEPSYIFATKLELSTSPQASSAGVKQILLLPHSSKVCVVCNDQLSFYTLPELSPAYDGITQSNCAWVGGLDRDEVEDEANQRDGVTIVICLRQRMRMIKAGTQARKVRNIELGGVTAVDRRGDMACVANQDSYSLLNIVQQQINELFPISSLRQTRTAEDETQVPNVQMRPLSRSFSSMSPTRPSRGHDRNISLGGQPRGDNHLRLESASPWPTRGSSRTPPAPSPSREASEPKVDKPLPEAPKEPDLLEPPEMPNLPQPVELLPANIVSPTPREFLLTTGTRLTEPGVGMFVNLDGDLVPRGTLEFSSYPTSLVLDGGADLTPTSEHSLTSQEGYVLAVVQKKVDGGIQTCIEIQRWDVDPNETGFGKEWLNLGPVVDTTATSTSIGFGLRQATSQAQMSGNGIARSLRLRRIHVSQADTDTDVDASQNAKEDEIAARFEKLQAKVLLFSRDRVQWVMRSPMIIQLNRRLDHAVQRKGSTDLSIDVSTVQGVFNSIRGQEPRDELEFSTLTYIRQKAALLLFGNLVLQTVKGVIAYEHEKRRAEDALVSGDIDPRIVLLLTPPLAQEVVESENGMWLPQGICDTVGMLRKSVDPETILLDTKGAYGDNMLNVVKQYLFVWRKKKGFGSVADESHVFHTVDAALIHILLLLDQNSPRGPAMKGSIRAELNDVVDRGVDCFDRAVALFEQFRRIYLLSRLYQNRRSFSHVLAAWKRILEGERDEGGEFLEGEQQMRGYLTKIRDISLVKEYGAWLAHRNPRLGVQVFADDASKIRFEPSEAIAVLQEKAPGAVKDYLEHLVFTKNHVQYVNDLIAYYLDTVLHALDELDEVRNILTRSYATYSALRPPKPTYRQFISDNAVDAEWWRNRLRLLQLIGGSHGAASKYDVHALRTRLEPYSNELVPEMIILNGREGKHKEALGLLTHGLGDYDTAIRYCLLGGSSIFNSGSATSHLAGEYALPTKEEQAKLFDYLLHEFFRIGDLDERLARTAELLERFGGWFDIVDVLGLIPDEWSVELVSGFLVHALRRLVREKNESVVVKALCGATNLRESVDFIEKVESVRPTIVMNAEVDAS